MVKPPPREPPASAVSAMRVSLSGFDLYDTPSARGLAAYLEHAVAAGRVLSCRVKTTCTPPGSYPNFQRALSSPAAAPSPYDFRFLPPPAHAFVHFVDPRSAAHAARWSGLHVLRRRGAAARDGGTNRSSSLFFFPGSIVEVGDLVAPDTFLAAWRVPDYASTQEPADFLVDPSGGGRCRLLFTRDAALVETPSASRSGGGVSVTSVLRCDVKLEFPTGAVAEAALAFHDDCRRRHRRRLSLLLRLTVPPQVHYRTAADDEWCHWSAPLDLLCDSDDAGGDDDHVTPNGAIGRCGLYRISIRSWLQDTHWTFWHTLRCRGCRLHTGTSAAGGDSHCSANPTTATSQCRICSSACKCNTMEG
ncbi:unnamed protein product [Urochloa humidicola]